MKLARLILSIVLILMGFYGSSQSSPQSIEPFVYSVPQSVAYDEPTPATITVPAVTLAPVAVNTTPKREPLSVRSCGPQGCGSSSRRVFWGRWWR